MVLFGSQKERVLTHEQKNCYDAERKGGKDMILSDRKKKILKAVVDDYIETAEPVSSKNICDKYLSDCSPATVRNELSALESMGYLVQPHVSAGRIPSEKAFRLYVDELMTAKPLSEEEIRVIDEYFRRKTDSVEELVNNVAKVISEITNLTSVVVQTPDEDDVIRKVTVVELSAKTALLVVVTDSSVIKDNIIDLPEGMDSESVTTANAWLNKVFVGKKVSEAVNYQAIRSDLVVDFALYKELYRQIVEILKKSSSEKGEVLTSGSGKIFDYPEYSDASRAKDFLMRLESKENLAEIFDTSKENIEVVVKIAGEEENLPEGCSSVSAKISVNDKTVGSAGVIGPVRMDYTKVISVLEHIGKLIDKIMTE